MQTLPSTSCTFSKNQLKQKSSFLIYRHKEAMELATGAMLAVLLVGQATQLILKITSRIKKSKCGNSEVEFRSADSIRKIESTGENNADIKGLGDQK
jgi:hypothetical protein